MAAAASPIGAAIDILPPLFRLPSTMRVPFVAGVGSGVTIPMLSSCKAGATGLNSTRFVARSSSWDAHLEHQVSITSVMDADGWITAQMLTAFSSSVLKGASGSRIEASVLSIPTSSA